jgi:hypothetical protein
MTLLHHANRTEKTRKLQAVCITDFGVPPGACCEQLRGLLLVCPGAARWFFEDKICVRARGVKIVHTVRRIFTGVLS